MLTEFEVEEPRRDRNGLIMVGFWRPKNPDRYTAKESLTWPDVNDHVRPYTNLELKQQIVTYLRAGRCVAHWKGYSSCRLCNEHCNGSTDLADSKYVWPEGLAHYIEAHDVHLPVSFLLHAGLVRSRPSRKETP